MGGNLKDCGFIGFSTKRRNLVISNAIGCAAYNGHSNIVEQLLPKLGKLSLEMESVEEKDERAKNVAAFKKEFTKYTPLMLAVGGSDKNLECVKFLLKSGANYKAVDSNGNNILHVAAQHSHNKILNYIVNNVKLDIFARNNDGETALNNCVSQKNEEGIKLLESLKGDYDKSQSKADELLAELT